MSGRSCWDQLSFIFPPSLSLFDLHYPVLRYPSPRQSGITVTVSTTGHRSHEYLYWHILVLVRVDSTLWSSPFVCRRLGVWDLSLGPVRPYPVTVIILSTTRPRVVDPTRSLTKKLTQFLDLLKNHPLTGSLPFVTFIEKLNWTKRCLTFVRSLLRVHRQWSPTSDYEVEVGKDIVPLLFVYWKRTERVSSVFLTLVVSVENGINGLQLLTNRLWLTNTPGSLFFSECRIGLPEHSKSYERGS